MILVGAAALAGVSAALAGYRTLRQHQAGRRLALTGPESIDETSFVRIGGIDQWVSIRGDDRRNPLLVVLHGGPGAGFQLIGYEPMRRWESDFTVVHWDQRGAGRTFGRHGARGAGPMSIDRMANDGIEVLQYALARTGHDKALVLGASWGSILGVEIARRRPDLLHAYVGAGQVVDMEANEAVGYRSLMERLRERGATRAEARLAAIGPPPYADLGVLFRQRRILIAHPPASERRLVGRLLAAALVAPGARLRDVVDWIRASSFSGRRLYGEMMAYCDRERILSVPVVIIQGDEDIQTPTALARDYLNALEAPQKAFVGIPGGGHMALFAMPEAFHAALLAHVRPLAAAAP